MAKAKKKINPFTVVKSARRSNGALPDLHVEDPEVAKAIDSYSKIQNEIRRNEEKRDCLKAKILSYARRQLSKRLAIGKQGNFNLKGEESSVTFIAQERSINLGSDDYGIVRQKWGDSIAESCLQKDIASVRFDPEVYEAHKDKVYKVLSKLSSDIGVPLFVGMSYRVPPNILDLLSSKVSCPEEMEDLITDLGLVIQIRSK